MKLLAFAAAFIVALSACAGQSLPPTGREIKHLKHILQTAKAIRINQYDDDRNKAVTITDPKLVREVLDAFRISYIERNIKTGVGSSLRVSFVLPDGSLIETHFLYQDRIDDTGNGLIYLESTRYYEKILDILEKVEAKPAHREVVGKRPRSQFLTPNTATPAARPKPITDLRAAEWLRVYYRIDGKKKGFPVHEDQGLQSLLDSVEVRERLDGVTLNVRGNLSVEFMLPEVVIETHFIKPDHLEQSFRGQIFLKSPKFYEAVCQLIAKREGLPIAEVKKKLLPD